MTRRETRRRFVDMWASTPSPSVPASAAPDGGFEVAEPRVFPDAATAPVSARTLYALAEACLAAETGQRRDAIARELHDALAARLIGDGEALAAILGGAPSVAVARQLWRALDVVWRDATAHVGANLAVTVFALPLVIVTGREGEGGDGTLSGVLDDTATLAAILRDDGALAGNRTFVLSNALVVADAIDIARLPEILAWFRLPDALAPGATLPQRVLLPAPLSVHAGREAVHLRFLVGTAIAKPGADLFAETVVGKWGVALTQELGMQLGAGQVSVLALARAPQRLLPAVAQGRVAQREVSAQIFASNAIRRFRGAVGEPTAGISAHRTQGAPAGGELRLSLSSPFEPRAAEGFRCPLYPLDRVGDVVSMLIDLMRDCRLTDIRTLPGVHADRVDGTGLPLLFKPDTIPVSIRTMVH